MRAHWCIAESESHTINALLNQEIVLFLPTVAQDFQLPRVIEQLMDEIVNHSMPHTTANYVSKAENPSAHIEEVAVRADEGFTAQLTSSV